MPERQTQHQAVAALADVLQALGRLSALQPPGLERYVTVRVDLDRLAEEVRAAVAPHTTHDAAPPPSGQRVPGA